jgi:DNA-directed RNA polymerase specialized sigma24 family protein
MTAPDSKEPVMPVTSRTRSDSPFSVIDDAFRLLGCEPTPLAIDGATIGHRLPARPIPLPELRSRLLHPTCGYPTRDAVLNLLIRQAQTDRGPWTVGLAGMLLPGLRAAAAPLVRACPGKADDIEAEMLAGLIVAIGRVDPPRPRPASYLIWQARHAAERLVRAELAERGRPGHQAVSAEPPQPFGHPDLVLARAVAAGVLSGDDAELIGATRLGELSLADAAEACGCSYTAARLRRRRAETALVAWLADCDGFEPNRGVRPGSSGVGRPRQGRSLNRRPELCQHPDRQPPASRR